MNVYTNIDNIVTDENSVITIGTFDGIHLGHQDLLGKVKSESEKSDSRNFLVTFEPHPRLVVAKNKEVKLLTTLEEKLKIFEKFGIENVLVLEFNQKLSNTEYPDFIENIVLKGIGAKHIVIGYDHKFGKNRSGDETKLRELGEQFGFNVSTVQPFQLDGTTISSTLIRVALENGEVRLAEKYLGRPYEFSGKVVEGDMRGRTIGFPTANIDLMNSQKLIPKAGVYAVTGIVNELPFKGIMNIGFRPTFEENGQNKIEIHLFNFSDNIYGETITIDFIHRIRDEIKFETKEALVHQIELDKQVAEKILEITN